MIRNRGKQQNEKILPHRSHYSHNDVQRVSEVSKPQIQFVGSELRASLSSTIRSTQFSSQFHKTYILCITIISLAAPQSIQDLKFPEQGTNLHPQQWKYGVLTTRPPGNSQNKHSYPERTEFTVPQV